MNDKINFVQEKIVQYGGFFIDNEELPTEMNQLTPWSLMAATVVVSAIIALIVMASSNANAQPRLGALINDGPILGYVISEAAESQFGDSALPGGWHYTCLEGEAYPSECFTLDELMELRERVEAYLYAIGPMLPTRCVGGQYVLKDGEVVTGGDLADIAIQEGATIFVVSSDPEDTRAVEARLRSRRSSVVVIWVWE